MKLLRICLLGAAFVFATPASADQAGGPSIVTGELPNGLKYSIERRAAPPRMAEMIFILRAGRAREEADQIDYAHLVEHLLIAEAGHTGNYGAKGQELLVGWTPIQSKDWYAGGPNADVLADTTRAFLPLDLGRSGGIRKPLEIVKSFFDFSYSPEQVRVSSLAIIEEGRGMPDAEARIGEDIAKQLGVQRGDHNSKFAVAASMENPSMPRLKAFHHKWYRPDLAEIHVSGDVDPAALETEIRSLFADLQRPADARPEPVKRETPPSFRVAMATSAEQDKNHIMVEFGKPRVDDPSDSLLPDEIAMRSVSALINKRFQKLTRSYDSFAQRLVFSQPALEDGEYSFTMSIVDCRGLIARCIQTTNAALWQIARDGVAQSELDEAVAAAKMQMSNRPRPNAMQLLRARAQSYPSVPEDAEAVGADKVIAKDVTAWLSHWLHNASRTVRILARDGERKLSSDEVRSYLGEAYPAQSHLAKNGEAVKAKDMAQLPAGARPSVRWEHVGGVSLAKVSLGTAGPLHVLFDDIKDGGPNVTVNAVSRSGYALLPPERRWAGRSLTTYMKYNGVGGLDMFELEDWQNSRAISTATIVEPEAVNMRFSVGGSEASKLQDLTKLIAGYFAPLKVRADALAYWKAATRYGKPSPTEMTQGVDPARLRIDESSLSAAHAALFSAPGNFLFTVSGVEGEAARQQFVTGLGAALLKNKASSSDIFAHPEVVLPPRGRKDISGTEGSTATVRIDITSIMKAPDTLDPVLERAIAQVVAERLRLRLREKESGVYSVTYGFYSLEAWQARKSVVEFDCGAANADRLISATFEELEQFLATGPTEAELKHIRDTVAAAPFKPSLADVYFASKGQMTHVPIRPEEVTGALVQSRIKGAMERANAAILIVGPAAGGK